MKLTILVSAFMALFGYAARASALMGPITSGGGDAVVCRDGQGHASSAELFDLFEGRALYSYIPIANPADYRTQARAFAKMLADSTHDQFFTDEMERILAEMRLLPPDTVLIPVDDIGSIIKPANCDVFQAAVYQPDQKVYFDSTIWNLFSETDKAALLSHEVLYAYLRTRNGATKSTRARQYVSFVFAGNVLKPVWGPPYSQGEIVETCNSQFTDQNPGDTPPTVFTTRLNADGTWSVSFNVMNGQTVLGSTELTGNMAGGFSWPATNHQDPRTHSGLASGFDPMPALVTPLDEGIHVQSLAFADAGDMSLLIFDMNGVSYWSYFSCQITHWGFAGAPPRRPRDHRQATAR